MPILKRVVGSSLIFAVLTVFFNNCGQLSTANYDATDQGSQGTDGPSVLIEAAPGPNLISNPDFENGVTGWQNYSGEVVDGVGRLGTKGYRSTAAAGGVVQNVAVVGGQTYRLVAYTKADANSGGATVRFGFTVPGGAAVSGVAPIMSTWQHSTVELFVPVGVTSAYVQIWKNAAPGLVYADDFSLRTITPFDPLPVLVAEGDSISVANTHTSIYAGVTPQLSFSTHAVGGSGIATLESRKAAVIAKKPAGNGLWVVTFLIGANDMTALPPAEYAARVFAYSDELRALGAKVAIGTVLPNNLYNKVAHNAARTIYNQMLRDNVGIHLDAVIDYDSDPLLGADEAATNVAYYPDGLHPGWGPGGGQDRMFQVYKSVVDVLLQKPN